MNVKIHNVQDVVLCNERNEHLWYQFKGLYMLNKEHIVMLQREESLYGFVIVDSAPYSYLQPLSYERSRMLQHEYPAVFAALQPSVMNPTVLLRLIAFTYNEVKSKCNYSICISFASDDHPLDAYAFFLQTGADYVHFLTEQQDRDS
ncbi:arylsulfatase regulator [Paenibacillus thiaminolyticus]|uniref:Arylsulfatase regulator n=1 Tax=Paenibacillus thiaminolyticus TaxID=49283 RepID=A0AAJ1G7L9_PANTH|nr:arylsulfatase regulator [Paenibacillus thiaminolyticus]MCY9536704.1 arylsulfatase regulator [Paenibacillus thiaminolyticus]MCY9601997.1 arylsulfatase regulator [Paenibacillus thiaminolyticus]MCY9609880.1 arylsulfatase regulator [Paenibacillus thiaminolyticus]MCY9613824.1 arylsulfatase regulator [Paenibacillus thiaminolyticus]MCY9620726.1 arylsulfatase regulator [Paenibacillus thiaminolyticus]